MKDIKCKSNSKKTMYIAEERIKSDRVDSRAIVELVRLNALPPSYMPPQNIAELFHGHARVHAE